MKIIKRYGFDIAVITAFVVFMTFSYYSGYLPGKEIVNGNFLFFTKELITILPFMFILIGLFQVWIPEDKVQRHIGKESGIKGSVLVVLLAFLQVGPLYVAFPIAYMLWSKGCSLLNIFLYLGAFSTMKIPMLIFEIGFLGLKFSILRIFFTIPAFIAIALILENNFKNKSFNIKDNN